MFCISKIKCKLRNGESVKKNFYLYDWKNPFASFSVKCDNLASGYVPNVVENGKYSRWEKNKSLKTSEDDSKKFTMIMPPPNITGTLHLGHALTFTIQDVLMRWHKMHDYKCTWIPGLDHAGIATQVVVERQLWQQHRKTRHDLGLEAFLEEVQKWRQIKSEDIRRQVRNLGALPNWEREYFTMDEKMTAAVNEAFIRLFDKGLIYRSDYLVNWSCMLRSAISDIEVEHLSIEGRTKLTIPGYDSPVEFGMLTKFAYKLCETDGEVIVSTTRPETIPGDVAVAVHPEDERYRSLRGKHVMHPFRQQPIPIIFDDFVDPAFGTGAVKVTPSHDPADFAVGQRHGLAVVQVIDECGNITRESSALFAGMKRFQAREVVIHKLEEMDLLRSIEDHPMTIPLCSRSGDVVEHLIKPQWFVNCSKMAALAAQDVCDGKLTIQPETFKKVWLNWLENIRDWCISRQLWWGHRIPAYICSTNQKPEKSPIWVAAEDAQTAQNKSATIFGVLPHQVAVSQDEDVLDTWFSSALLPFAVFGWPKECPEYHQYYPTTLLETGHDILFFWVARMVMLGRELTGQLPFEKILLHGVICDAHGRKMSKSLGNVIAPEQVISGHTLQELESTTESSHKAGLLSQAEMNKAIAGQRKMFPNGIPQCGADSLRFTLLSHNIQSHFINFNVDECYTNKLFCNKIWQALKYTRLAHDKLMKKQKLPCSVPIDLAFMDKWILSRLWQMVDSVDEALHRRDFHVATASLKDFFYSEFCDVYLETTKPSLKQCQNSESLMHVETLIRCLETGLRVLSPFMPHLCEELYQHLPKMNNIDFVDNVLDAKYPKLPNYKDIKLEEEVQIILDIITVIRRLKKIANFTSKHELKVYITTSSAAPLKFSSTIKTLSGCQPLFDAILTEVQPNKTLSDTIGNHSTVYLFLPENGGKSSTPKSPHLSKKIEKISGEIMKMENMINSEGYQVKACVEVQKKHSKKLTALKEELARLQHLNQL